MEVLNARHIQMADNTSRLEPHWGYVDRVLPCTNDAGSCEYLDAVYVSHHQLCPGCKELPLTSKISLPRSLRSLCVQS